MCEKRSARGKSENEKSVRGEKCKGKESVKRSARGKSVRRRRVSGRSVRGTSARERCVRWSCAWECKGEECIQGEECEGEESSGYHCAVQRAHDGQKVKIDKPPPIALPEDTSRVGTQPNSSIPQVVEEGRVSPMTRSSPQSPRVDGRWTSPQMSRGWAPPPPCPPYPCLPPSCPPLLALPLVALPSPSSPYPS